MRTENDLRAALLGLEAEAPDAASVLAGVPRRRGTSRRTLLLAGAAAVTVAAVPVTARLLTDRARTPAAPGGPPHPLEFTFRVPPYDGQVPVGFVRDPRQQKVYLRGGGIPRAVVTVYEPGAFDATPLPAGEPVTVAGRPGRYLEEPAEDLPTGEVSSGVFWEYAPDAWASAWDLGVGDQRGSSLRAAEAVRFGWAAPMRLPYRVDPPPAGLRPHGGSLERTGATLNGDWQSRVVLAATPDGPFAQIDATSLMNATALSLTMPQAVGESIERTDDGARIDIRFETFFLAVRSPRTPGADEPGLPIDVLRGIAYAVTPATDFQDQSTWFDPREALPL